MSENPPSAKKKHWRWIVLAVAFVTAYSALAQSITIDGKKIDMSTPPTTQPPKVTEADVLRHSERAARRQTHHQASKAVEKVKEERAAQNLQTARIIVIAEYTGEYQYYGSNVSAADFVGGTYYFKPLQILKGVVKDADKIEVKVIFKNDLPRPENPSTLYKRGGNYLLFLNYVESQSNLGRTVGHHWYTPPTTEFVIPLEER